MPGPGPPSTEVVHRSMKVFLGEVENLGLGCFLSWHLTKDESGLYLPTGGAYSSLLPRANGDFRSGPLNSAFLVRLCTTLNLGV